MDFPTVGLPTLSLAGAQEVDLEAAQKLISMRPFLADSQLRLRPPPEQVFARLKAIQNNLPALQAQEVSQHLLDVYGIDTKEADAYSVLKKISAENLRRVMGRQRIPKSRLADDVQTYVHSQFQAYSHNMNAFPAQLKAQPLLISSRQLDMMALYPGLQSNPFNRNFLKTQNWIFFHVGQDDAFYGQHVLSLNAEYAKATAMVAPFVMYVHELISWSYLTAPAKMYDLENILRAKYPERWAAGLKSADAMESTNKNRTALNVVIAGIPESEFFEEYRELLTALRASMKDLLFTTRDFERLTTFLVTKYLQKIQTENPDALVNWKNNYRKIVKAAMTAASLPDRFELRIPVAIPMQNLLPDCRDALVSPTVNQ